MARLITLTERETALLMAQSAGRVVPLSFGSDVWLQADKAPWAATLLATWRGILVADGAGI
jgi:hypothetical protein